MNYAKAKDFNNMKKVKNNIKPTNCTICSNEDVDKITNIIKGVETDVWFCLRCGGLIGWIK